ncbi:MAG: hypothetical protein HYY30_07710 [Chloroflexi bacterium]|nr:hypothetical protein [Chloroflexota bacterium]
MEKTIARTLTHREFLKLCGLALVGAGAGQVVLPPTPALADQIQGNLDVTGAMISLGTGTAATASSTSTYGSIVARGSVSNFNLNLQDGSGRVNLLWNATGGLGNYVVSSEPATRLMLNSNGAAGGTIAFYGAAAGVAGNAITWTHMGYLSSSDQVWFSPRGVSSDLYIGPNGNVGIGTTSPTATLEVRGAISSSLPGSGDWNAGVIDLKDTSNNKLWQISNRGSADVGNENKLIVNYYDGAAWFARMTIDTMGNVGIGTISPEWPLEVVGDSWATRLRSSDNAKRMYLGWYSNRGQMEISTWDSTNGWEAVPLQVRPNIVSFGGKVGIGTTTPEVLLHVAAGGVIKVGTRLVADDGGCYYA